MPHRKIAVILHFDLNGAKRAVFCRVCRRVSEYVLRAQIFVYLSVSLIQIFLVAWEESSSTRFRCNFLERPCVDAHGSADTDRINDDLTAPRPLDGLAHLHAA